MRLLKEIIEDIKKDPVANFLVPVITTTIAYIVIQL